MFEERKGEVNVHVTEARVGAYDLAVEDEEKGENRDNLLVNPLSKAKVSCVIVIDALDECIDDQPASAILSVLGQFVGQLSLVKFFITGRPEPRIRTGFRLPLLKPLTQVFLLHEVKPSSVNNDIQLYLTQVDCNCQTKE